MIKNSTKKFFIITINILILLFGFYCQVSVAEPGIKIIEPLDGAAVTSGKTVSFIIEPVEGFDLEKVFISSPFVSEIIPSAPFEINLLIPKHIIGRHTISAFGKEVSSQGPSVFVEVSINVQPEAILQSLNFNMPMYFLEQGDTRNISVNGLFSDSVTRKITKGDTGTTYQSSNNNVVTVNDQGFLEVQGLGKAFVIVSNSGVSNSIPVTVKGEWLPPPEETIPPTITATLNPSANQAGWHNKDVTVTFVAKDNEGGSGVKEIIYVPTGATPQNKFIVAKNSATLVINSEGRTLTQYWVIDNEGNSSKGEFLDIKLDKTPPVITAEWIPVVYEDDDDDEEDLEYTVNFRATDNLDKSPSVVAVIETPDMDDPNVKLEAEEDEIKYVFELEDNEVKIESVNPEEAWTEIQELGGIAVSNGQIIKTEYEDDEFTAKFKDGKLNIEAPEIVLRITATDAAGNQETVLISPPIIPEEDDDKDD